MSGAYQVRGRWTVASMRSALTPVAAIALLAALTGRAAPSTPPTVEELKGRVSTTSVRDRPHLCVEIAERQLTETDRLYAGTEDAQAQAALTDVVTYCELARDYSLQSRKHQKQTEIAVRGMARRLTEIMHTLPQVEQEPVQKALQRLQRVRDDLLAAMFPKADK